MQQHAAYLAAISAAKLLPHVHNADARELPGIEAAFQCEKMINTRFGAVAAFHIRRCTAEKKERIGRGAPVLGRIAGMVARRIFGFVGILLLLVDDDEAEIAAWGKHGTARTDHNTRPAGFDTLPLVIPLANGERAVQNRDIVPEIRGENTDHLRCKRDLRHEQDGRFALSTHCVDQMDVYRRLSAAGNAVEK